MFKFSSAVLAAGLLTACTVTREPASTNTTASEGQEQPAAQGPACGKVICAVGEVCCNPSCSVCTPPDGMCTQQLCMDDSQRSEIEAQTGQTDKGEPAPAPGGKPTPAPDTAPKPEDANTTCANVRCMAGTHCEMVQVQCVRAPCNPVPECKPDAAATPPVPGVPPAPAAGGQKCGKNTCAAGQTCCNSSCGICTKPGHMCIQMFCSDGNMPR